MPHIIRTKDYRAFLLELKARIEDARLDVARSVNKDLIALYIDIGKRILEKQQALGWGRSVIETLSQDLLDAYPGAQGFSPQNLWLMRQFVMEYTDLPKLQQLVGGLIDHASHMKILHLALLTSGGDAPGMNAAIRAVVRTAHFHRIKATGIMDGYDGLVKGNFIELGPRDVRNIVQRGGTMLRSARSEAFRTKEGRATAAKNLRDAGIDALICIGGGGTQAGAHQLALEQGVKLIGVASTIDNDLGGSDRTIGFDTACNTALEAIDRLRDTASSYGRIFFVEVMGRDTGFIAMHTGIAAGAEYVMVPERRENVDELVRVLENRSQEKGSSIVVVAEGDQEGGAFKLADLVEKCCPQFDIRVSVLGHLQRGGNPTLADRLLASRLGAAAVEGLMDGKHHCVAGVVKGAVTFTPHAEALVQKKLIEPDLFRLLPMLAV